MSAPRGSSVIQQNGRLSDEVTLLWIEDCPEWAAAGNHLRGTQARLAAAGIPVAEVIANTDSTVGKTSGLRGKVSRIGRLVSRGVVAARPGVLIARWHPFTYPVMWAWHRKGGKVVLLVQGNLADLHDSNPWTRKVPFIAWMARKSLSKADAIATPSSGLAEWIADIADRPRATTSVIPNGVKLDTFEAPSHAQDARSAEEAFALFVGNFAAWQGIDVILEAFRSPGWPEELSLRFIGDGQHRELITNENSDRVQWLGVQPRSVVGAEMSKATVALATRKFVDASATGVSPFKVIEAAAAGVAYVATRVPGQTELAEDLGGGILIEPDDASALAEAVSLLARDETLRTTLGAQGRKGAEAYAWEARADQLAATVRSVYP